MVAEKDLKEYYQCSICKKFFTFEELVKVRKNQNIIQALKGQIAYKVICKSCINLNIKPLNLG